jgi:transposase
MQHALQVLEVLHQRMSFFSSKRFKRLKFKTYIKTQKAYEKIVAKLKNGVENTLVIWGNAKFPSNGRGSPSVPTSTLLKKVKARVKVIEQDEYNTSKLSCCCHQIMSGFAIAGVSSYHVRVCPNVNCPRNPWDRNVSAAINILFLFKNYNVDMNETPVEFRRAPPPAVAAVPPVAGQMEE